MGLLGCMCCRSSSVEHSRHTSSSHYVDPTFFELPWFTEMEDEMYSYGNLCASESAELCLSREICFACSPPILCPSAHVFLFLFLNIVVTNPFTSQSKEIHCQNLTFILIDQRHFVSGRGRVFLIWVKVSINLIYA